MADQFKIYNKTPLASLANIKGWQFTLREVTLIGIVLLFLLILLIVGGLYGGVKSSLDKRESLSAADVIEANYCTSPSCIKTATRLIRLMNKSVDPCDNFYQYACANYKNSKPVYVGAGSRSILDDMQTDNQYRLIHILEGPISESADSESERKLKTFFRSCNNMGGRERLKGTPFLRQVVSALGGWKLLGTWDQNWDFNTALKKVQNDFSTDAFYTATVQPDADIADKVSINIEAGGIGVNILGSWRFDNSSSRLREYRELIRSVGSLFLRDARYSSLANGTGQQAFLEEFTEDAFTFESTMAQLLLTSSTVNPDRKMTLANLTTATGNVIDFTDQISNMFNASRVNGSTVVVVANDHFIKNLTDFIASFPATTRKRMLHNYLIWRVAAKYIQFLSTEYIQASRKFSQIHTDSIDLSPVFWNCFRTVELYLPIALNSLYATRHLTKDSKSAITDMTQSLRRVVMRQIDLTPWFDQSTKSYAKEKLNLVKIEMAYPDWMANKTYVDKLSSELTIDTDFFRNMLNANRLMISVKNKQLLGVESGDMVSRIYTGKVTSYTDRIALEAGTLQPPVYQKDQANYENFGSLGSILGQQFHQFIDENGMNFDKNGNTMLNIASWWSKSSLDSYKSNQKCVSDIFTTATKSRMYLNNFVSFTNGIRIAVLAYNDWLRAKSLTEKSLPGIHLTNQQMVFLAHAQTYCYDNTSDYVNWVEEVTVNTALGQLREFSETFNCKLNSKMNSAKKCDYY